MLLFGRKSKQDDEDIEGLVIARVTIEPIGGYMHQVSAYVVERSSGETIYKTEYKTIESSLSAYYKANDDIRRYIVNEGMRLDGDISTNIELPFVRSLDKSSYPRK